MVDADTLAGKLDQHRAQLLDHRMIPLPWESGVGRAIPIDQLFLSFFLSFSPSSSSSSLRYG
jgi:hypothetical protein